MRALKLFGYCWVVPILYLAVFPRFVFAQPGWQRTTDYPTNGFQFDPVQAGGRIYVAGGFNGVASSNVFFSVISANASLGNWTATTPLPEADPGPGVEAVDGWIYVALGSGLVFRAPIQSDGSLG